MLKKITWAHGIILALASFIGFILFMILVFPNGKQNSDLVSNNYYEDELAYQEVIDAKKNAQNLTEKPIYQQTSKEIKIKFPATQIPDGKKIQIVLFRTDDALLDVKKELILDGQNSAIIPEKVISKGSYTLQLKWQKNKKNHQLDYDVLWK